MPENIYKRGTIWWCRFTVAGEEQRRSLRTSDRTVALKRAEEERTRAIAASHFGDARTTYLDAFVAWGDHLSREVGSNTAERYMASFRMIDAHLKTHTTRTNRFADGTKVGTVCSRSVHRLVSRSVASRRYLRSVFISAMS